MGNGVSIDGIESLRDRVLELRIQEETQEQGALTGFLVPMKEVESNFSSVDDGIGANLDGLFNSITRLSTDPTNISLRQNVLTAADNLAASVRASAQTLRSQQQDIDRGLVQRVDQVNQLSSRIASLNSEMSRIRSIGAETGEFEDQRTEAIKQLSGLIGVSVVDSDDGVVVTTANGAPLVVAGKSFALEAAPDRNGAQHIFDNGTDITSTICGGEIAGLIRARDSGIADVLRKLNAFASGLVTAFNDAHRTGFDLNGNAGANLFVPTTSADAAANMRIELADPAKVAASADGSTGDNGNLACIASIQSSASVEDMSPASFYAGLVASIGSQISNAEAEQTSSDLVLSQLQIQRASVSGVSLDEEAANLIRYQRAFEAAARVVSVVNDLTDTILGLGRN